ncbi:MAG: LysE family translocator [Kiloniellales bacterium]
MNWSLYLPFVVATAVMIALPGPSVMLTIGHSLAYGWRRGLLTTAGTTCGVGVQLAVALAGMTSFMLLLADWFEWLRWAGVAYLVYLGIQQWRAGAEVPGAPARSRSRGSLFLQGLVVTTANPKSLFFLAAFFPQFVDPAVPPAQQFPLLAASFLVITYVVTGTWAILAGHARAWFATPRQALLRNRIAGGLLIGAGLGLAMVRRG